MWRGSYRPVSIVVADDLVPIWCQDISKNDSHMTHPLPIKRPTAYQKYVIILAKLSLSHLQYIPCNIFMVCALSCIIVVWYWPIWPISIRVTSLTLGQSYDCPSVSEAILRDMGKHIPLRTDNIPTSLWQNKAKWNRLYILNNIHSSAIITRSNRVSYCRNWGRSSIRVWAHKR